MRNGTEFCNCHNANWYGLYCELPWRDYSELFTTGWIIHQVLSILMLILLTVYAIASIWFIKRKFMNVNLSPKSMFVFGCVIVGNLIRIGLLVDIWGFWGLYNEDGAYLVYFITYGLWISAMMMEIGIWLQIVLDAGKLQMSPSWGKAIIFAVIMSLFSGGIISVVIPIMWFSGVESARTVVGLAVSGVLLINLILGVSSGLAVRYKMNAYGFDNQSMLIIVRVYMPYNM
eukprot:TRINITY_DN4758_c0_g1_i2.p1 TRINITY_DN4758_c0_g1~~TRINITY_DN4758_c0_g1_i2.p1  ORF type:complete len:255 (-),score=11.98 TRINITY_DN4758_c0_g1_i2:44-733(-)